MNVIFVFRLQYRINFYSPNNEFILGFDFLAQAVCIATEILHGIITRNCFRFTRT